MATTATVDEADVDELAQLRTRVPSLIVPFIVVGAIGGWLSGRVLAGPLAGGISSDHVPGWAAVCCAFTGGLAGMLFSRQCRDEVAPTMRSWRRIPMPLVVLLTGAVSGMLVAWGLPYGDDIWISAGLGTLASLAFVPLVAYVLAAAKRAARARHGSLVAASDRRAVWGALVTSLGIATLASLPEWEPLHVRFSGGPLVAVAIALLGGAAATSLALLDLVALMRIRRVMRTSVHMQERDPEDPVPEASVPRVDLGLGANLRARTTKPSAYRHAARITEMVVGNFGDAYDALRRAARRSIVSALILVAVGAVHYQALPNYALRVVSLQR